MKTLCAFFLVLLPNIVAMAQLGEDLKLPETWEKNFVVTLTNSGSMSGNSSNIRFTYDSVVYTATSNKTGRKIKTYLLKANDRAAILKNLHEQKIDKIKSESGHYAVSDGWSTSLCVNSYCIEGGTSAEMNDEDKNQFLTATRYLEEFAIAKTRKL